MFGFFPGSLGHSSDAQSKDSARLAGLHEILAILRAGCATPTQSVTKSSSSLKRDSMCARRFDASTSIPKPCTQNDAVTVP